MTDLDLTPPRDAKGDTAYAVLKAGVASIPVVGGGAAELLGLVLTPPLSRRQTGWMEAVAEAIEELRRTRGISPDQLARNDSFIDTVLAATQAALRTSHGAKLKA